jgi:hypothetical protein
MSLSRTAPSSKSIVGKMKGSLRSDVGGIRLLIRVGIGGPKLWLYRKVISGPSLRC